MACEYSPMQKYGRIFNDLQLLDMESLLSTVKTFKKEVICDMHVDWTAFNIDKE